MNEITYQNMVSIFFDKKINNINLDDEESIESYSSQLFPNFDQTEPKSNKFQYELYETINTVDPDLFGSRRNKENFKINFKKELHLSYIVGHYLGYRLKSMQKVFPQLERVDDGSSTPQKRNKIIN